MKHVLLLIMLPLCLFANPLTVKKVKRHEFYKNECVSYLIEASRNDSLYIIISPVYDNIGCGEVIRKRKTYEFVLDTVYPYTKVDSLFGYPICPSSPYMNTHGLRPEKKYHNMIYRSKNTNGKYMRSKLLFSSPSF